MTAGRFGQAVKDANDFMRPYRQARRDALEELVGPHYPGEQNRAERSVNLIAHSLQTLIPHLASNYPRYNVKPKSIALAAEALTLELVLGDVSRELDLVRRSHVWLLDALLGPCAVVKIGLKVGADLVKVDGRLFDPGMPYVERVDLDDYVFDTSARSWDEVRWEGHRYRVSRQVAMQSGLFDPKIIESLPPVSAQRNSTQDGERVEDMAGDHFDRQRRNDFVDLVELYDVAVYDNGETVLLTLPGNAPESAQGFLRVQTWEGPQRGPFERLEFFPLPSQPLGLPFVSSMMDMHHAIAAISNKLVKQAEHSKKVLAYRRTSDEDAKRIADAPDMDSVAVDDPDGVQMIDMGGVHESLMAAYPQLWGMAQIGASLPDMLSGASDSDTATEYQGRMAQASSRVGHLGKIHEAFHSRIASHLGFYLTTDPFIQRGAIHRLPGGEQIELKYDAATKRGGYPDFAFEIQARSMQAMDPAVRARRFNEAMGLMLQAAQVAISNVQLGVAPLDLAAFARTLGQMYDMPEFAEMVADPITSSTIAQHLQQRMAQLSPPMPAAGMPGMAPGVPTPAQGQTQATTPLGASRDAREFANGNEVAA